MISFTKAKLENGWMGNMSSFPITYMGKEWRTSEALFQALRFNDPDIQEEIRFEKSPMASKMVAKRHADKMIIAPTSPEDLKNMDLVLRLKLEQHPHLLEKLLATGEEVIIEDVTKRAHGRNMFWGMALKDGVWVGENQLGYLWMFLRKEHGSARQIHGVT